ncbi:MULTISPECIES: hypothetical protein [Nostocales]|jgi:hypothetical protein|uniref:hypothetical protein n=1 Tax=Nostocales TaxID=1161 RepID=UPI0004894533|nr:MULTISPECIES: hypothetical protein [Nostocales]MBO1052175.1 hypothetical protein [Dolichospermum sp. DET73]MDK2409960.1 hypothetical protein [Aphanizomenon sp. 202]MDK2461897.1 hypothetical protein [Aphanizomenon sp. PH219]OBQ18241.1 MAG: hypothetical protein AN486_12580 [Anabaena sp. AL93]
MHFLINELSFIGQAANDYEADELIKNILEIIQEISVIQNGDPIQTHSSFASQKLSANLTVHEWILTTIKSKKSEQQKIAMILLRLLSKGPFIDLQNLIDDCQCFYQKKCVSSTSLAGAAQLQGILISLQNNPDFIQENIEVEFQEGTSSLENRSIKNLTEIKQARKIYPRYKLHSKHDPKGYWENATPMNLTDKEAQKVLNISVGNSNENSEKRYGFHKETDQFYVFHSDNTFDEQGYPTYHGFPITENQVPPKILIKIKR